MLTTLKEKYIQTVHEVCTLYFLTKTSYGLSYNFFQHFGSTMTNAIGFK